MIHVVKYIIDESGFPTLFKTNILHIDILNSAISAGYAIISYDLLTDKFSVKCYGGGESLKVSVNVKDCVLIQDYLNRLACNLDLESVSRLGLMSQLE
jgi:hypothetical protein